MAKLMISTQYTENYGSADEPYWKFKGGMEYFVLMDKGTQTEATMLVMAARSKIEFANDMATEYIIDWKIVADDYMTDFEKSQLEYDGKIAYPAATIEL
jgi:hypothetical protein